jgi:hypothetical protein
MISNEDYQFISKFDNSTLEQRVVLLGDEKGKMQVYQR